MPMPLSRLPRKPCGYCESTMHFPYQCFKNPHLKKYGWKGSKSTHTPKVRKGQSKHQKLWNRTRREWFIANPQEFYNCYICGLSLMPWETTLDHVRSRSRYPELRYVMENLQPCCWDCNTRKGSKDLDELWAIPQYVYKSYVSIWLW